MLTRRRILVRGIVQGVGFRPFLFRLADRLRLSGTVRNSSAGVAIEVQGRAADVERFLERLPREAPRLALILGIESEPLDPDPGLDGFRIVPSTAGEPRHALLLPDVALCDDCLSELRDPNDRRHRYPFINCTNCGPRFTIARDIPYDRPLTAMADFPMCRACEREYRDPEDRRFHAQATCCPACGPHVRLVDRDGRPVAAVDPIAEAARRLAGGAVLAIKGLGGFHLAADALDAGAVGRLRERKRRVAKPFAVMLDSLDTARRFVVVSPEAERLLRSPQAPIVLLPRRPDCPVVREVAPGTRELGVFLPYTPLHRLLFDTGHFRALVMTSGNLSEEPIACGNEEALRRLRGLADAFLLHDREILHRCDDSVVRPVRGIARPLRRSRGYVPVPVPLPWRAPPVLGVGGELKNTVCFLREDLAFPSQHIGDLENLETFGFFREAIEHLGRLLGTEPRVIAHDQHPDYLSTVWARRQGAGARRVPVQHHHAHVAACMAENGLEGGPVIGIALDGAGYGPDGTIWGGEILIADYERFERAAHLEPLPLPGGDAAVREPWRMAIAWLERHLDGGVEGLRLPPFERLPPERVAAVRRLAASRRVPMTSSCGRLFDAVAALAGLRLRISFEAQAAIELEMAIERAGNPPPYPFAVEDGVISPRPTLAALLEDVRRGRPPGLIARRFHDGLLEALLVAARRLRRRTGIGRVALSGGCFQNAYLSERLEEELEREGFEVFVHRHVPAGDGGLSLGQAAVAARRLSSGGASTAL
ncbi:MAG: carbamoyltransferase HypF [Acidobacteria bacterium]|nr:MAG: carbamoyltransferase HypF [Acidobacteriota bacterium]